MKSHEQPPFSYGCPMGFSHPLTSHPRPGASRSTVVAMQDLGSGGSDHHAVATVFEIDTAGVEDEVMFKEILECVYHTHL